MGKRRLDDGPAAPQRSTTVGHRADDLSCTGGHTGRLLTSDTENGMSFWTELRLPAEHELLVGVYDCHWLAQHADKAAGPLDVLSTLAGYFAATATVVTTAGG